MAAGVNPAILLKDTQALPLHAQSLDICSHNSYLFKVFYMHQALLRVPGIYQGPSKTKTPAL